MSTHIPVVGDASSIKQAVAAMPFARRVVDGATVSLLGSTVMGGLMVAADAANLMNQPPPFAVTRQMMKKFRMKPRGRAVPIATALAHFGYGAVLGSIFGIFGSRINSRAARVAAGAGFGAAAWAASYAGWIPAVGWVPFPTKDRMSQQLVMLGAHVVFGAILGMGIGRMSSKRMKDAKPESTDGLDAQLADSFPASDPPSMTQPKASVE